MGHDHSHQHGNETSNISFVFWLNTIFAVIELVGGLMTNSVAIISDSLHDFGDSLSLGTAWYFQRKSQKGRDTAYTYGYKRFSLIGAFINSLVLVVGSVFVVKEAIGRLMHPEAVDAKGMLLLAIIGVAANAIAMLRLKKGSSVNERVVSLHFLEDVLGWVAVLIGSVIMMFADVPELDPILSLAIAGFILFNVYRNIKPAFRIVLQGVPHELKQEAIIEYVRSCDGVEDVHDFHVWTMDGTYNILSMHIVARDNLDLRDSELLKKRIKAGLKHFDISHATIELEHVQGQCGQIDC